MHHTSAVVLKEAELNMSSNDIVNNMLSKTFMVMPAVDHDNHSNGTMVLYSSVDVLHHGLVIGCF